MAAVGTILSMLPKLRRMHDAADHRQANGACDDCHRYCRLLQYKITALSCSSSDMQFYLVIFVKLIRSPDIQYLDPGSFSSYA